MKFEIYQEMSEEWAGSIASHYPQLASMAVFDAFDAPWAIATELKSAIRAASKFTGRRFTLEVKSVGPGKAPLTVQVKRVG